MKKFKGILHAYFETGMEGVEWAIQESRYIKGENDWDLKGLKMIDDGDHLTIFNPEKKSEIIWQGNIKLIRSCHLYRNEEKYKDFKKFLKNIPNSNHSQLNLNGMWIHSIPANIDIKLWMDIFMSNKEYEAILIKKE